MRTRGGCCYPSAVMDLRMKCTRKRQMMCINSDNIRGSKRLRAGSNAEGANHFNCIPDDVMIFILRKLSSGAQCPGDFISVLLTCRRFNTLGVHPMVLARASAGCLTVKASAWCGGAHNFLKQCADAGNIEACYTIGMIRFYCLENRGGGVSLMAKAAISSHAAALYSLGIIQFNGSGGTKKDKDLKAGVALCARSAFLGHVDALRELGHCLKDGYGIARNIAQGRRFLVQANARELASILPAHYLNINLKARSRAQARIQPSSEPWLKNLSLATRRHRHAEPGLGSGCPLLSDFGCNVPPLESHPANKFLVEWFGLRSPNSGLRMCSYADCGRPETRKHEFRRCSVCGTVNYCSRACQALDWKIQHRHNCTPVEDWLGVENDVDDDVDDVEEQVLGHPFN